MSNFKERLRLKGKSIEQLYEAADVFDRKNFDIKTNHSGSGISITKQGLLTIQKHLADKIGDENLEYLELRQQFSDSESLLILKAFSKSDAEKLENFEVISKTGGALKKRQNTKKQVKFSVKMILRAYIEKHGSEELNSRWKTMFNSTITDDLEANGYTFEEDNDSLIHEQTDGGQNMFVLDIMSGEGVKQSS